MLTETQYPALFGPKSLPEANRPKKKSKHPDLVDRLKKAGKKKHVDGMNDC